MRVTKKRKNTDEEKIKKIDKTKDKSEVILNENIRKEKKEASIGRTFLTILSILLFISSLGLGYFCLKYYDLKKDNNILKDKIDGVKINIVNIDSEYTSYSDELDKKKVELKDKIEEYNIWLETIEKVK